MNIKDAIERGLYPKDAKGRALVPVENEFDPSKGPSWTATICATDGPGGNIVGFGQGSVREWGDDGTPFHTEGRLLPPPPRKVEVKVWALLTKCGSGVQGTTNSRMQADDWRLTERCPVVELTGSYEIPWD